MLHHIWFSAEEYNKCACVLHSDEADAKTPARQRQKWSKTELDILQKHYKDWKRPPTFPSICELTKTYPTLKKRSPAQIKTRAWSLIKDH